MAGILAMPKPVSTKKPRVVTYLDEELKARAEKVAEYQGRSLSNYIEQLVKADVARAEAAGEISEDY